jgi:transposase-like protein
MNLSCCAAPVKLTTNERKVMAVRALAGAEPISALAARHGVSRPLVYRQMHKASAALDDLFSPAQTYDQNNVLFSLPVTKQWLEHVTLALALTMIGHASMRGVMEFMNDLLGVSISLGTVHNIHQRAALQAITINDSIDLSAIRVGLHDEIFQGSQPVLTGIDAASTYCFCWPPKTTATAKPGRSICSTCKRGG